MRTKRAKSKSGLTIIEVVIAGFLTVVLGFGIMGLQRIFLDAQLVTFDSADNVGSTNFSLTQMARELRAARQADSGAYPLVTANDNEIVFYSDVDYDNRSERVRYWLDGTVLRKSITKSSGEPPQYLAENTVETVVTENVRNQTPIFIYFNADWPADTDNNPLFTPADIAIVRALRVSLVINSRPEIPNRAYTLETHIQFRNLKDNL